MNVSAYLAAGAACVAAGLSGTGLMLTQRWHRQEVVESRTMDVQKWALEALKQALIDHINLSFTVSRVCNDAVATRGGDSTVVLEDHFKRAQTRHHEYVDLMVYLRLLATSEIVECAEALHRTLDELLDASFEPEVAKFELGDGFRRASLGVLTRDRVTIKEECMGHREALINAARAYIGLPRDAVISRGI